MWLYMPDNPCALPNGKAALFHKTNILYTPGGHPKKVLGVDISLSSPLAKGFLKPIRVEIRVGPTKQGGQGWVGNLPPLATEIMVR